MVKLGLIVEGVCESIILKTQEFKLILQEYSIELIEVQIAGSKNQLWGSRIESHRQILIDKGAEHIIVLVDLDLDICITETKNQITAFQNQTIVVTVREIESWFLADHLALSKLLDREVDIEYPQQEIEPYAQIIQLNNGKGFGSKTKLAMMMKNRGFSLEAAASHPNCPSASYFLEKLKELNELNP